MISLIRSAVMNILGPFVLYTISCRYYPASSPLPLLLASLLPAIELGYSLLRSSTVDAISVLAMVQFGASIGITLGLHDARSALEGHAVMPAAIGALFLLSCAAGRPLLLPLARQAVSATSANRRARFEEFSASPVGLRLFRELSWLWGAGLVVQALAGLIACRQLPTGTYLGVSGLIGYSTIGALAFFSVRRARRLRSAAPIAAAVARWVKTENKRHPCAG